MILSSEAAGDQGRLEFHNYSNGDYHLFLLSPEQPNEQNSFDDGENQSDDNSGQIDGQSNDDGLQFNHQNQQDDEQNNEQNNAQTDEQDPQNSSDDGENPPSDEEDNDTQKPTNPSNHIDFGDSSIQNHHFERVHNNLIVSSDGTSVTLENFYDDDSTMQLVFSDAVLDHALAAFFGNHQSGKNVTYSQNTSKE